MKKLVIGLLIVTGILAVAPFFIGMQAQSRIETGLDTLSEASGSLYEIKLKDYDRGWFESRGVVSIAFSPDYLAANPALSMQDADGNSLASTLGEGFSAEMTVAHGPILWGRDLGFGIARLEHMVTDGGIAEVREVMQTVNIPYFVRTHVFLNFDGSGALGMDAPSFEYATEENGKPMELMFAGAQMTGSIAIADMHVIADGVMNGVSGKLDTVEYAITPMKFSVDMKYPEEDPYGLGYAKISMDRFLMVNSADNSSVDMAGVSLNTSSEKGDDEMVNFAATYRIDRIAMAEADLTNMALGASIGNVRSSTIKDLQETFSTFQTASADPASMDPAATMAAIVDPAYNLIADGATLAFDPISFTMNDQPLNVTIRMQAKPENLPDRAAFDFSNPLMFLGLFKVHTTLSAHRELVIELAMPQLKEQMRAGVPEGADVSEEQLEAMVRAQAPMMIGALVGQGYIREEGNLYTVEATFDNGELTVNGTPLPLGALMGAAAAGQALSQAN